MFFHDLVKGYCQPLQTFEQVGHLLSLQAQLPWHSLTCALTSRALTITLLLVIEMLATLHYPDIGSWCKIDLTVAV